MDATYDALIVGGGAAGLSAALTLGRSCRRTIVCDDGKPRNFVAQRMHGFLTRDGTPPARMLELARGDLERYPSVELCAARIEAIERRGEMFRAIAHDGKTIEARAVILAMGVYDALPAIDGIANLWGKGVYVCPYCDGWEVRDRRIAVSGNGARAVELAQELHQWSDDVLVCFEHDAPLDEKHVRWLRAAGAEQRHAHLVSVEQSSNGLLLSFGDGSTANVDALFLCAPLRQKYPLVAMLGCAIDDDGKIAVDDRGRTGCKRVYAAGDCVTNVHQVILAAASGVCAAMALNEDLLEEDVTRLADRVR